MIAIVARQVSGKQNPKFCIRAFSNGPNLLRCMLFVSSFENASVHILFWQLVLTVHQCKLPTISVGLPRVSKIATEDDNEISTSLALEHSIER